MESPMGAERELRGQGLGTDQVYHHNITMLSVATSQNHASIGLATEAVFHLT